MHFLVTCFIIFIDQLYTYVLVQLAFLNFRPIVLKIILIVFLVIYLQFLIFYFDFSGYKIIQYYLFCL